MQGFTKESMRQSVLQTLKEQETTYKGTLEDYLRSLWHSVYKHSNESPSWQLFANIIRDAFTAMPSDDDSVQQDMKEARPGATATGYTTLKQTILEQIADLKAMTNEQLNDELRFLGIESPSGNTWYNWDPISYLSCAMAWLENTNRLDRRGIFGRSKRCNWSDLAAILEAGRLYE